MAHYCDLPTYEEATARPDWLTLVAPYIPLRDYAGLCRVSRRFYCEFAPRLWADPLTVICRLRNGNDPDWAREFLYHAETVRPSTCTLVRAFDARLLFAGVADFPLSADTTTLLSTSILKIFHTFPSLTCLLLDGKPTSGKEEAHLLERWKALRSFAEPPLLLSLAHCQAEPLVKFFDATHLQGLVYLDISHMQGSGPALAQALLHSPTCLQQLRILKARGLGIDDGGAGFLFDRLRGQLWSIDLSGNKLTDAGLDIMTEIVGLMPVYKVVRFQSEGRAVLDTSRGSPSFGHWHTVTESNCSRFFCHPARYLADPPVYALQREHEGDFQNRMDLRLTGLVEILPDSADALKLMFAGAPLSHPPTPLQARTLDVCQAHRSITHLYLNGIHGISSIGLARAVRNLFGRLQHLECDSPSIRLPVPAPPSWLSPKTQLFGFLGWAHVFRPILSADLQVLRIHHSIVTQIPSLEIPGLSQAVCWWLAETHLLPRAKIAYPEVFVPDMNPRLRSLVLTRIPRRSSGPLIDKLIEFLRLAAAQERDIQEKKVSAGGAFEMGLLPGLRHIRFEFEPDVLEDGWLDIDDVVSEHDYDLDAGTVLDDTTGQFSFFGESGWSKSTSSAVTNSSITATTIGVTDRVPAASANTPESAPSSDNLRPGPSLPSTTSPHAAATGHEGDTDSDSSSSETSSSRSSRSSGTRLETYPDIAVLEPFIRPPRAPPRPITRTRVHNSNPDNDDNQDQNPEGSRDHAEDSDNDSSTSEQSNADASDDDQPRSAWFRLAAYRAEAHLDYTKHTWTWAGKTYEMDVYAPRLWIPRRFPRHYTLAECEYARLANQPGLQYDPCPATPNHADAGIDLHDRIFLPAWDAILYPQAEPAPEPSYVPVSAILAERARFTKDAGTTSSTGGGSERTIPRPPIPIPEPSTITTTSTTTTSTATTATTPNPPSLLLLSSFQHKHQRSPNNICHHRHTLLLHPPLIFHVIFQNNDNSNNPHAQTHPRRPPQHARRRRSHQGVPPRDEAGDGGVEGEGEEEEGEARRGTRTGTDVRWGGEKCQWWW
ncbi:hypothetical protein VTJ04DRAFT_8524 [Mycothermus thermophilus]|uniref:uncharacterized protein n=1 Tax=Humicola insolens TaxID=85995 RepID=UPI0037424880